jgi:hypothetical protein
MFRDLRVRLWSWSISRGECPTNPASKVVDMTTMKAIAHRAIMFLGTMAAFAFIVDGAKRW